MIWREGKTRQMPVGSVFHTCGVWGKEVSRVSGGRSDDGPCPSSTAWRGIHRDSFLLQYGLVAVEEEVGGRRETKEPNDPSSPLPLSLPNCWLSVRLIKP